MHHGSWQTPPIRAGVGLRHGCSAAPRLFRWILQDCTATLREVWLQSGPGLELQTAARAQFAWADDTWLVDATQEGLNTILSELQGAAW